MRTRVVGAESPQSTRGPPEEAVEAVGHTSQGGCEMRTRVVGAESPQSSRGPPKESQ